MIDIVLAVIVVAVVLAFLYLLYEVVLLGRVMRTWSVAKNKHEQEVQLEQQAQCKALELVATVEQVDNMFYVHDSRSGQFIAQAKTLPELIENIEQRVSTLTSMRLEGDPAVITALTDTDPDVVTVK